MSKVILYIASSVDGFIAEKDGGIDWLNAYQNESEDYGYADFIQTVGASIMGSGTYEIARSLEGGIDPHLPTFVVTRSDIRSAEKNDNVHFVSGTDLRQVIRKIQQRTQKNIWLVGGGELVQSFLKERLIDEIVLSTIPILLGNGIPLFRTQSFHQKLAVRASKSFADGVVQTHYLVQ